MRVSKNDADLNDVAGTDSRRHRVVVIGAGFGGISLARRLSEEPVTVIVVDRRNFHLFQPLLYQVATAALSPGDIAAPIRAILRKQENAEVVLGEVQAIDVKGKKLQLKDSTIAYDTLVIATGATHSYFGHGEWANLAPGLKTIEDAIEMRRRIFTAFERAENEPDEARRQALLTFVIVGGGPTGVELAGALAEIARRTLTEDFRHINPSDARVILVEASERLLTAYPESLSQKAQSQLADLGVEVLVNSAVTGVSAGSVTIGAGEIQTKTVLWAAGVKAESLVQSLGVPLDRAGRVIVNPDLSVPSCEGVYAIGDIAHVTQKDGTLVPGVAPAAIQMGQYLARSISERLNGSEAKAFSYFDKGSFAVIGRAKAVGMIFNSLHVSGFFAWLSWLLIHIMFLVGFRNRLFVVASWAYTYLTHRRGARLITGIPTTASSKPERDADSAQQRVNT